jgi:ATP-binding cassette subfamily F protein 3
LAQAQCDRLPFCHIRSSSLLLDEPTNHLEIEAQDALEQALRRYPGTVIVVSHDRFFLDALGPGVASLNLGHAHNS